VPIIASAISPAAIGALNDVPLQTPNPPRKSSGSSDSRAGQVRPGRVLSSSVDRLEAALERPASC
jgi:hypothetical protein